MIVYYELRDIKTKEIIKIFVDVNEALKVRKVSQYVHRVEKKEVD